MRMRTGIVLAVVLATLTACRNSEHEREVAALRAQLAEKDRQLTQALADAKKNAEMAEKALGDAKRLQARVTTLETFVEAFRDVAGAAAAQPRTAVVAASTAQPRPLPQPGQSAWQELEREQAEQRAAWRRRLESTVVHVREGGGGPYHVSGCDGLYVTEVRRDGTTYRRYASTSISLAAAEAQRLVPDPACGPPSYELRQSPRW